MANLEDTAVALRKRMDQLGKIYEKYLDNRERFREVVETFDDDLATLHQIPVFPCLMRNGDLSLANLGNLAAAASVVSSNSDRPSASTATNNGSNSSNSSGETSLLDWINSKGGGGSLEQVADDCFRSLERLDAGLLVALRSAVEQTVETSEAREMKEVKGLSERLQGMENLIRDGGLFIIVQMFIDIWAGQKSGP